MRILPKALIALVVAGLVGLSILSPVFSDVTVRVLGMRGTTAAVFPALGDALDGALLVSTVDHESEDGPNLRATWFEVVDVRTGATVSTEVERGLVHCYGVAEERLWCWGTRLGLQTRALSTGKVDLDQEAILRLHPQLAGRLLHRESDFVWDPSGRILVSTNDGFRFALDGRGSTLTPLDGRAAPSGREYRPLSRYWMPSEDAPATLEGASRSRLVWGGVPSSQDFLKPEFLVDRLRRTVQFDGPPGVVLAHFTRLSALDHAIGLQLSRVGSDGRTAWTHLPRGALGAKDRDDERVLTAWLTPAGLFLVSSSGGDTLLSLLDPATGAPLWSRRR